MKKLLYLFFAITLLGCSSNDDGISDLSETGEKLLVKSINWTKNEGAGGYTSNGSEVFTYDGSKIVQIVRTSSPNKTTTDKYIYTNNLISRIDSYDNHQDLQRQISLEYDTSDRLNYIEVSEGSGIEYYASLEYSSSNTSFTYTATGVNNKYATEKTIFQLNNGNIVSFEGNGIDAQSMNCSYDNKHNPFKNIIGKNAGYGFIGLSFSRSISGSGGENNIVAYESTDTNGNTTSDILTYVITYDYNDKGYPRNIIWKEVGYDYGGTDIIEYY